MARDPSRYIGSKVEVNKESIERKVRKDMKALFLKKIEELLIEAESGRKSAVSESKIVENRKAQFYLKGVEDTYSKMLLGLNHIRDSLI